LEENPHEKQEVEKEQAEVEQTTFTLDMDNSESSDDAVETPRDSAAMKSNTAIGTGTGGWGVIKIPDHFSLISSL
jgi:hypothetical protein